MDTMEVDWERTSRDLEDALARVKRERDEVLARWALVAPGPGEIVDAESRVETLEAAGDALAEFVAAEMDEIEGPSAKPWRDALAAWDKAKKETGMSP